MEADLENTGTDIETRESVETRGNFKGFHHMVLANGARKDLDCLW